MHTLLPLLQGTGGRAHKLPLQVTISQLPVPDQLLAQNLQTSFCSIPRVDSHCNASITDSLPIPSYL
jgi:hypothetical protein